MRRLKAFWGRISIQKKLYLIFGLMAVLIVFELLTLKYAMTNLSAVRAFVYGESVWSKAQKDSAYYLKRMALTKDEKDYELYREALFVPHECRLARLELYKENPDMELVRRGFINGKIHPDEVGPILHMIRTFDFLPHIQTALRTWREADELLQEFERVAENYRRMVFTPGHDVSARMAIGRELDRINLELGKAEDRFSFALQEGARWLENVVLISLISLVVIVEVTGFLLVFFFGNSLAEKLNQLIDSARRIGRGEFEVDLPVTTGDEVGKLTAAVNTMGQTIKSSHSELERKISERTNELNEAIKTRDEFYSIASHELKTPVTAIQLSLQMMQKSLMEKNEEVNRDKLLFQINKSVELSRKLTTLQDTLMDVARISGGMFDMELAQQDLMRVVKHSVEEAQMNYPGRVIEIAGPDHCYTAIDPVRIGQVITNLILNGLKYGGGTPVHLLVTDRDDRVEISVSDKGPGISRELHEKVFDQFIRVNPDKGISGLGMGLYIARKIIEAHGGSLKLDSSNLGTTFTAILPKKSAV